MAYVVLAKWIAKPGEEEAVAQCRAWQSRRGGLDFEIDGAVVKVSDLALQRQVVDAFLAAIKSQGGAITKAVVRSTHIPLSAA